MTVPQIVAVVVVSLAALIDVKTRRIPNMLTFGGALAALGYHAWTGGLHGLSTALLGWGLGIALFLPMFLLRGMGAGDVKLLGAVGAWLGPLGVAWSAFLTVMAGGIMALVIGARHGYLGKAFRNLWHLLGFWRTMGLQPQPGLTVTDSASPKLAYGVAIAAGTIAAVLMR